MSVATPIPQNQVELSLTEIAQATGGMLRAGAATGVRGITTDSRADVVGKLFVALEGENFDGHRFVADVVRAGAAGVVVSRDVDVPESACVLRVEDSLAALGALARFHRRRWGGTLIAVGGSAGKTTTKSAVAALLDAIAPGAVHAERGNLNNLVGVPMVLLGLDAAHRFAVVELGTNTRGEIAKLAAMVEPDIGVLTLVAIEHSAGIGDLDAIEREEGDLLASLGPAGVAVGNGDDERVRRLLAASPAQARVSYGAGAGVDYRVCERRQLGLEKSALVIERRLGKGVELFEIEAPLVGLPGALAVVAAIAVVDRLADAPLDRAVLARAFASARIAEPGRLSAFELADGSVVVDDTYNSNPASVLAATQAAREIAAARGARLVLVLGEMRELGALSSSEHSALGPELARSGAAALIAVGGDAEHLAASANRAGLVAEFSADAERALPLVLERVQPGDVVLIKASRGIHAERIVEGIVRAKGRAA